MIALLRRLFGRDTTCRCGHDVEVHRHWRRGSDCGSCGADVCGGAARPPRLGRRAGVALIGLGVALIGLGVSLLCRYRRATWLHPAAGADTDRRVT